MRRIRSEAKEVFTDEGKLTDQVKQLKIATACFQEAMRLRPPLWIITRRLNQEVFFKNGIVLPKGSVVIISPYIMHHRDDLWDRPYEFNPGRFLSSKKPQAGSFMPFGLGPRVCIGMPLAMMEGPLILSLICNKYQDIQTDSHDVNPAPYGVLFPDREIVLKANL